MRRVVKVGGSLLLRKDLLTALPRWIERQTAAETFLVFGGGVLVDAVRSLDQLRAGDPAETHWLCVDLLDVTYRLASQWFHWPCIDSPEALEGLDANGLSLEPTLVAVRAFYDRSYDNRPADNVLPMDWRTTTDAIAALLSHRIAADELVLLKSCEVAANAGVGQLAKLGIVDEAMPLIEPFIHSIRVEKLV